MGVFHGGKGEEDYCKEGKRGSENCLFCEKREEREICILEKNKKGV